MPFHGWEAGIIKLSRYKSFRGALKGGKISLLYTRSNKKDSQAEKKFHPQVHPSKIKVLHAQNI